ncbi:MAG: hypothetical protein IJI49_05890 [Bacilli bacterium]|nr:hypothetical protein [Bacilli bacterium]
MKIVEGKIITLGNNERYLVVSKVVHNDNQYFYIAECNEDNTDIKDNYKIVKATYEDNKIFIDEVVGEANLKTVLPLFVNNT